MKRYTYPRIVPRSSEYAVKVNGHAVEVLHTASTDFATFEIEGPVEVEVTATGDMAGAVVRPASRGIAGEAGEGALRFRLPGPMNVAVEAEGRKPLFVFADGPEKERPDRKDPRVKWFAGGQVYEVGELELGQGETLYIEAGAVVRGCVRATSVGGVRIAGRGVLDGGYFRRPVDARRSIILEDCEDGRVEDIIMVQPSAWMVVLAASRRMRVEGVRQIGEVVASDGVDVVSSRDVVIRDCFLRNNDDCVVVKALTYRDMPKDARVPWRGDVENVRVERCVLLNDRAGHAMEIGHELSTDHVRGIVFRDIDVLSVHGHGSVFSIHNGDRALVEDVLWERVRVEHHYDKLVDLRVIRSRYSRCEERGRVRGVVLRDIDVALSPYNAGYTVSLIGGYDAGHLVEDVRFENFRVNGVAVRDGDAFDLHTRHARGIRFEVA